MELMNMLKTVIFQGKLRMNQCRYFKDDLCTLEYDPNQVKGAPIQVIEEKDAWGTVHMRIKPTPLWCACCPHHSI